MQVEINKFAIDAIESTGVVVVHIGKTKGGGYGAVAYDIGTGQSSNLPVVEQDEEEDEDLL